MNKFNSDPEARSAAENQQQTLFDTLYLIRNAVTAISRKFNNDKTRSQSHDRDGDGLSDSQERQLGTAPNHPDSDRDGLSDFQEVALTGSDPLLIDTDNDGISDFRELIGHSDPRIADSDDDNQTDGENNNVRDSTIEIEAFLDDEVVESNNLIDDDAQLLLPENLEERQKAQTAANKALELFEATYSQYGATTYKSKNFEVNLKGFNSYEVTSQEDGGKIQFETTPDGLKIISSSFTEREHKSLFEERLSNIALGEDLSPIADEVSHEVRETARNFLHYAGVERWDREKGNYKIESNGSDLTIFAKDGRGEIFKFENSNLTTNLSDKDINFFKQLRHSINVNLEKVTSAERNIKSDISRRPKRQQERELTL